MNKPIQPANSVFSLIAVCVLSLFLIINFFAMGKYAEFPWWHSHGNDADVMYMVTALGLVNDADLISVQHPGATYNAVNAFLMRVSSYVNPSYASFRQLEQVSSLYDVFDMIDKGVAWGRVECLVFSLLFTVLMFFLFRWITNHRGIAFLLTFYLIASSGFLIYTYWIRVELFSLILIGILIFYTLKKFLDPSEIEIPRIGRACVGIGFLLGLLIFTKIQLIGFVVVFVCALIFFYFINTDNLFFPKIFNQYAWISLIVGLFNFMIFPWWAIKRPESFPPGFRGALNAVDSERMMHLQTAENYYGIVFAILGALFILTLVSVLWKKSRKIPAFLDQWLNGIVFIPFFVFGFILSIYGMLLPSLTQFAQYTKNTQFVLYTLFTNLFDSTFLKTGAPVTLKGAFEKIQELHQMESALVLFNGFYIVLALMIVCMIKIIICKGKRKQFFLPLGFFLTGIFMDAMACFYLRDRTLYNYYAIYSFPFFVLGMAAFLRIEWPVLKERLSTKMFSKVLPGALICLLILNVFFRLNHVLIQRKPVEVVTYQDPLLAYEHVLEYTRSFFDMGKQGIRKSSTHSLYSKRALRYQKKTKPKNDFQQNLVEGIKSYNFGMALMKKNPKAGFVTIAKAIKHFRQAIRENPREQRGYLLLANTYINVKAYKEAIQVLEGSIIEFPNDYKVHQLLAICYEAEGDQGLAIANTEMSRTISHGD